MTIAAGRRVPVTAGAWRWGERQRFFVENDRLIRTPIPTSRRISVFSLVGGAGASTIAAGVATLAARRRASPVLAVDAAGARYGLADRLGRSEQRLTDMDALNADPQSFADAARALVHEGDLHYLGLGHPDSAAWPSDVGEWQASAGPTGRFFPLVVTDWGRRRDLRAIADITRVSHAVCLVAPADRAGLENAAMLVPALRGEPAAPEVVLVLVDRTGEGAGATRVRLGALDARVLRVPFDPALSEGSAPGRRTRAAMLQVAATLIGGAATAAPAEVVA